MWFFIMLAAFAALGLLRRPATVRVHLFAFFVIVAVLTYEAATLHLT
jgi:hypothetical protein